MIVTRSIDYNGCESTIAENLINNKATLCYDPDTGIEETFYVIGYDKKSLHKYNTDKDYVTDKAIPIKREMELHLNKASELIKYFEENEYSVNIMGDWYKEGRKTFHHYLFLHCGKKVTSDIRAELETCCTHFKIVDK